MQPMMGYFSPLIQGVNSPQVRTFYFTCLNALYISIKFFKSRASETSSFIIAQIVLGNMTSVYTIVKIKFHHHNCAQCKYNIHKQDKKDVTKANLRFTLCNLSYKISLTMKQQSLEITKKKIFSKWKAWPFKAKDDTKKLNFQKRMVHKYLIIF